jgi:Ca2+-binding RTX toxin-like protein
MGNIRYNGLNTTDNIDFRGLDNWPFQFGVDYLSNGGNDLIFGTKYDDSFTLGNGAEIINGRGGQDTVIYQNSTGAIDVNLNNALQHGGFAEGDLLISMSSSPFTRRMSMEPSCSKTSATLSIPRMDSRYGNWNARRHSLINAIPGAFHRGTLLGILPERQHTSDQGLCRSEGNPRSATRRLYNAGHDI